MMSQQHLMDYTAELDDDAEFNLMHNKYLVFSLAKEQYALPASYISEIIGMQSITAVPNVAEYIQGVINLRGKVISVFDTRIRLGLPIVHYGERTCIIITHHENFGDTGFIVDAVVEVADVREEQISAPPATLKGYRSRFLKGMIQHGDVVRMVLDIETMLRDEINEP